MASGAIYPSFMLVGREKFGITFLSWIIGIEFGESPLPEWQSSLRFEESNHMRSRSTLITVIICLMLVPLLSACSQTSDPRVTSTPVELSSPTDDGFPRVDGSTSTAPLGAMIVCTMMEVPCEWVTFVDGNRYLMPDLTGIKVISPVFVIMVLILLISIRSMVRRI